MTTCKKIYTDIPWAHRQHRHDGHCAFIHGHNWSIAITFGATTLDENGFVVDFGKLKFLERWIDEHLDHACVFNADDPMKEKLLAVGGAVLAAGLWAACQDPTHADIPPQHLRMFLKRRYWLYYALTFFSGARRQIYMVFSMFLLVKVFHFSVQAITLLFIINNVINWLVNPMIGRAINAFGERTLCTVEYAGVVMVFLTYAYSSSRWVVAVMYVVDYILFNFAVAIRTYFQKIAEPGDIAPSSAVGFTINHIAAVFLPALGGYLWMIDYRVPFLMGAALGVVSLVLAQFIRVPTAPAAAG